MNYFPVIYGRIGYNPEDLPSPKRRVLKGLQAVGGVELLLCDKRFRIPESSG